MTLAPPPRSAFLAAWLAGLSLLGGCDGAPDPGPGSEPASGSTTVVLLGTTDVHGWLLPFDYTTGEPSDRGLALLAPLVDSIRAAHPGRVVLVDSGDLLQGSPMAAAYTPLEGNEVHPVVAAMNLMEYDAAALGNHEFNFGVDHVRRALSDARFPFVAANVVDADRGTSPWPTHTLVELDVDGVPLRVGVTGVLPPGVAVWDRDHVEGRLQFPPMLERLARVVPQMQGEGADLVLVAAHSGLEGTSYDTLATGLGPENQMLEVARQVPGIHAVFMGHTHATVADTVLHGVRFAQAGANARSLAVMEFDLAPRVGGGWEVLESRGRLLEPGTTPGSGEAQGRIALESLLEDAHARTLERVGRVLAVNTEAWPAGEARVRDTPLMQWVSQVQRDITGAELSAVAAFSLDAGLPAGEVRVSDLARLYPYDNNLLRAVEINGGELRAYLEHAAQYFLPCPEGRCERLVNPDWPGYNFDMIHGVEYTLDLTQPVGERVVRLERRGEPVRVDQVFTLALNNYRQGGGGGFPAVTAAPVRHAGTQSIRDLLIADLESRGASGPLPAPADPGDPGFQAGWEIIPVELRDQALREMRTGGR